MDMSENYTCCFIGHRKTEETENLKLQLKAVIDVAIEVLIFNIQCKITIFVELSEPTAERY